MNNSIELPKRNPLVLTAYAVAIIGMLGFMVWVIWPYSYEEEKPNLHASHANPVHIATTSVPGRSVYREPVTIVGSSQWIELKGDSRQQIDASWRRFAGRDLAAELYVRDALRVYAVYHRYDAARNRVLLTLGYPVPPQQILPRETQAILIEAGDYLQHPGGEVLRAWEDAGLADRLKYVADLEEYQLDPGFNVITQTAFVAMK